MPLRGRLSASLVEELVEATAILGAVDRVGARPEQLHAALLERHRELQRRLAAELHDDAVGFSSSQMASTSSSVSGSK
jgi:hypothetical protein